MIPVYQTLTTLNDGRGNCFMACVASIMEMPLRDVPHLANDVNGGSFFRDIEDWLIPQGLFINHWIETPKGWSIAGGVQLASRLPHAVVAFNGRPVHDPFPLAAEFGEIAEFYTIDPITEAQRPYCDERLRVLSLNPENPA